jgi:glycosyltransferase involved in cell wall biosynthesis
MAEVKYRGTINKAPAPMKKRMQNNINSASRPFFSIIIATYNRAQLVTRALRSLSGQTEKDWEAIVIDDESTDETYEQLRPFLLKQPAIKYLRKVHGGEASSKNAGISYSRGKFISFLDSDDEYDSTHLEIRKAMLLEHPSVKFLYGGVRIIGNQYVVDRFDHAKKINLNDCVIGGSFFIERNLLLSLNGFRNIQLGTDAELFDRIKTTGVTMKEIHSPTYVYHHENMDSITNQLFINT